MTHQEFDALVARLERQSRESPGWYKLRVFLLAFLGYGYVWLMLMVLLVLSLLAIASAVYLKALALKIAIPILVVVGLVLKAMWVRLEAPAGTRLERADAPALFEIIDRIRARLRAPRFHRVLLTPEFNAAVVQIPRLGLFGWHRNYLLIGLPLMKALTREQFEAVLAHEFGHLAGGHAAASNWIYRLRMTWDRLVTALKEQRSWGTFMFRRFFNWYAPYFAACTFPLARANEYEADAAAARLVSPAALGQALTAVNVVGSYLEQSYWPGIYRRADDTPRPGFAPYSGLNDCMVADLGDEAQVQRWLEAALGRTTTSADTHPSLSDRLKAIDEAARFTPPPASEAADTLLGARLAALTSDLDRVWHEQILPAWEQRYREVQQGRSRLTELEARAAAGELPVRDAFEKALLTESVGADPEAALAQLRVLRDRAPGDPGIAMGLGLRLLARDDEAGVGLVTEAMALDEDHALTGCVELRNYCARKGREADAQAWHDRAVERANLLDAAREERATLHRTDRVEVHQLPAEAVAELRRKLQAVPGLRKAYLVRKAVQHLPHHPLYILGFTAHPWWRWHSNRRAAKVQQAILAGVVFPGETLVFNVEGSNASFAGKLRKVKGARIL